MKVDANKVNDTAFDPVVGGLAGVGDARGVVHGLLEGAHKDAKEESVYGGADGLVQDELDGRVADRERRRRRRLFVRLFGMGRRWMSWEG